MSAKRQATSNLNHDNWDQEEEPEDRGTFPTAPEEELNKRVIKKARRKIPETASDATDGRSSENKSVFSGFCGFGKPSATLNNCGSISNSASPFSFLSKLPNAVNTSIGGQAASSAPAAKPTFSFGNSSSSLPVNTINSKANNTTTSSQVSTESRNDSTYYGKLRGLNQAVSEWIKKHVDKNPLCILTPIFKDYEKHLEQIQKEQKQPFGSTNTIIEGNSGKMKTNTTIGSFKFSASSAINTTTPESKTVTSNAFGKLEKSTELSKTNGFSFGIKADDKSNTAVTSTTTAAFSFGNASMPKTVNEEKSTESTGFSFTPGATPFSFANIKPPTAPPNTSENDEEDENDQPPKVEFKQVVEDDAIFSKKCKVFVKKNESFTDRGVGTLYLKPIKDSGKTQLLVRADTNLGNILVNLILSTAIPVQRMGKNNVMLICLPIPEAEKPTPMLLRVKTSEEADELLEIIEKHKK